MAEINLGQNHHIKHDQKFKEAIELLRKRMVTQADFYSKFFTLLKEDEDSNIGDDAQDFHSIQNTSIDDKTDDNTFIKYFITQYKDKTITEKINIGSDSSPIYLNRSTEKSLQVKEGENQPISLEEHLIKTQKVNQDPRLNINQDTGLIITQDAGLKITQDAGLKITQDDSKEEKEEKKNKKEIKKTIIPTGAIAFFGINHIAGENAAFLLPLVDKVAGGQTGIAHFVAFLPFSIFLVPIFNSFLSQDKDLPEKDKLKITQDEAQLTIRQGDNKLKITQDHNQLKITQENCKLKITQVNEITFSKDGFLSIGDKKYDINTVEGYDNFIDSLQLEKEEGANWKDLNEKIQQNMQKEEEENKKKFAEEQKKLYNRIFSGNEGPLSKEEKEELPMLSKIMNIIKDNPIINFLMRKDDKQIKNKENNPLSGLSSAIKKEEGRIQKPAINTIDSNQVRSLT